MFKTIYKAALSAILCGCFTANVLAAPPIETRLPQSGIENHEFARHPKHPKPAPKPKPTPKPMPKPKPTHPTHPAHPAHPAHPGKK